MNNETHRQLLTAINQVTDLLASDMEMLKEANFEQLKTISFNWSDPKRPLLEIWDAFDIQVYEAIEIPILDMELELWRLKDWTPNS